MRQLLLLPLLFFCILTIAQVPNYEFENWENFEIQSPDDWVFSGNVIQSTDVTDGSYSVRLENKANSEPEVGFVANTMISDNFEGGQPYSDIPLVMRFDAKYNLAQGDVGKAFAIFKASGQAIGTVDFSMTGNTADTFITYKIPIQWFVSAAPDSLILLFVSNDFENNSVNGDGYMIIDNVVFESFGIPDQQVDNPSFENWGSINISHPTDWYTTSLIANDLFGFQADIESVVKSTESHSGFSALLQNKSFGGDILPGVAFTGTAFDESFPPAFEVSDNWEYLQGYYKYTPENEDTGAIAVLMYQNGNMIGSGQFNLTKQVDDITYFSTPIGYFAAGGAFADSASIVIAAADFENPKGVNTKLWVDKLTFTNDPAGINDINEIISIFPNPANNEITISVTFKAAEYKILDVLGKEVISSNNNKIDISTLPKGTYFIRVTGDDNILTTSFIKS